MKNKGLPDSSEWEKIINDAFSSDEEHVFSENYKRKKHEMQRSVIMKKKTTKKHFAVPAAAVIAAAVIIPTSVYAYNKVTASVEKTANYQTTIKIPKSDETEQLSEKKGYKYYELSYVPDGYQEFTKRFVNSDGGDFWVQFYELPDDEDIDINFDFSENYETYQNNDKTTIINYRVNYEEGNAENHGRNAIISFDGTHYIMHICLTDDISREELIKIIDGVNLIDTEEKMYGTYIPFLDKDNGSSKGPTAVKLDYEKINIKTAGETTEYKYDSDEKGHTSYLYEKPLDEEVIFGGDFDVTLNSYEFTDSFDGIHTDGGGNETDFSEYMDENGNIKENIRRYIILGDGVNTINETVAEESIPMHILKINATFTNTDTDKNEICISPHLYFSANDSAYNFVDSNYLNKYGTDHYEDSIQLSFNGSHFSLYTDWENRDRNVVLLAPGESLNAELAFLIPDDIKDSLYLMFTNRESMKHISQVLNEGKPAYSIIND